MSVRLAAAIVTTCLCGSALAQTSAPNLTRQQRDLLQGGRRPPLIAPSAPRDQPITHGSTHVLRASDGSHYVAFSVAPPGR